MTNTNKFIEVNTLATGRYFTDTYLFQVITVTSSGNNQGKVNF